MKLCTTIENPKVHESIYEFRHPSDKCRHTFDEIGNRVKNVGIRMTTKQRNIGILLTNVGIRMTNVGIHLTVSCEFLNKLKLMVDLVVNLTG